MPSCCNSATKPLRSWGRSNNRRRSGLSVRSSVARGALSWVLVASGFVVVRFFLPLLPPPVLGAGMAFGAGGILYLAAVSWSARQATLAGSLAALATGAALMGLVRAVT